MEIEEGEEEEIAPNPMGHLRNQRARRIGDS